MTNTAITTTPETGLALFDRGHFDNLCNIASHMAKATLIPQSLRGKTDEETAANCLLVTEQSHRWGMSPFAVAQCASVVHGRLMWEGKLVAAVVDKLAGIRLCYTYSGAVENRKVVVSGKFDDEVEPRTVEGTVAQWKTDQWKSKDYDQRLSYRGAREWARRHAPAVMLGVTTDDDELPDPRPEMRDATPRKPVEPINPFTRTKGIEAVPEPVKVEHAPVSPAEPVEERWIPAHIVSTIEQEEGQWVVVLRGEKKDTACVTETAEIGEDCAFHAGTDVEVTIRRDGKTVVITGVRGVAATQEEIEGDLI